MAKSNKKSTTKNNNVKKNSDWNMQLEKAIQAQMLKRVYFDDLPNFYPYDTIRSIGDQAVSTAATAIPSNTNTDPQAQMQMQSYINFMTQMAQSARNNEVNYLAQARKKVEAIPDGQLKNEIQQFLNTLNSGAGFDYPKMIASLQYLVEEYSDQRRDLIRNSVSRFTEMSEAVDEYLANPSTRTTKEALQKQAATSFESFKRKMVGTIIPQWEKKHGKTMTKHYYDELANRIEEGVQHINSNATIVNQCRDNLIIALGHNVSLEEYQSTLAQFAVEYFSSLPVSTIMQPANLADDFEKYLKTHMPDFVDTPSERNRSLISSSVTSYRKIAATGQGSSFAFLHSLGQQEWQPVLDDLVNKGILAQNEAADLARGLNTAIDKVTPFQKGQYSAKLNQAYLISQLSQYTKPSSRQALIKQLWQTSITDLRTEYQKQFGDAINQVQSGVGKALSPCFSVKVKGYDLAEHMVHRLIANGRGVLSSEVLGKSRQTKQDVFITFIFNRNKFIQRLNDLPTTDENRTVLEQIIDAFYTKFKDEYLKSEWHQTDSIIRTDVHASAVALKQTIQDTAKSITNHTSDKKDAKKLLKEIIFTGISVKAYTFGNNTTGFTGGSLGDSTNQISANITEVYKYGLGKKNLIDPVLLNFAIINCGENMLGKNLKLPVSEFLLGAAAIMMFDDGIALTKGFVNQLKRQGLSYNTFQLFKVNDIYVPASFIYQSIADHLKVVYFNNNNNAYSTLTSQVSNQVIIKNITKPYRSTTTNVFAHGDKAWFATANFAEKNTKVKFNFLIGLQDILTSIQQVFSEPIY